MDKKKNKKENEISFDEKFISKKLGSKSFFIKMGTNYIDSNNLGQLFLYRDTKERNLYQKWEFTTDTPGTYLIKNVFTGLYLTTDERGNIYVTSKLDSVYQKWTVYENSSIAIRNNCNKMIICKNKLNQIFMKIVDKEDQIKPEEIKIELLLNKPVQK
jgi:hypothetical protein